MIKPSLLSNEFDKKEKRWIKLIGKKRWLSLDKNLREWLVKAAGCLDLGFKIDIKKAYKYSIYND